MSLVKEKTVVKCLMKKQHVEVKDHRMASLNLEEAHRCAVAKLLEELAVAIDNAFATTDIRTNQLLLLEQQRLEAEAGYTARIREERQLADKNT